MTTQHRHNKALHPTAYSFARRSSSLRFRRRVSLVVLLLASIVSSTHTVKHHEA
jgi:hypothetical protein